MGWLKWKGRQMPTFLMLEQTPSPVRFEQVTSIIDMPDNVPQSFTTKQFKSYPLPVTLGFRPGVTDRIFMNEYSGRSYTNEEYDAMSNQEIEDLQFDSVYNWLSGTDKLTFSNDSDKYYNAICNAGIVPERISRRLRKLPVQFTLMPFRHAIDNDFEEITLDANRNAWLTYHGTYPAPPVIRLYGNGTLGIFIAGSGNVKVYDVNGWCEIDVARRKVFDKDGHVILENTEGDFTEFRIANGTQIKCDATVTKVEIKKNTRWR